MGGFQTETTHLVKENARRGEEPSVDVGAFVAGRLLGRVETGDDEHHAAGRGNGVIAETLHEAADQDHVDELLVGALPILGLGQFEGLLVQSVELTVSKEKRFK